MYTDEKYLLSFLCLCYYLSFHYYRWCLLQTKSRFCHFLLSSLAYVTFRLLCKLLITGEPYRHSYLENHHPEQFWSQKLISTVRSSTAHPAPDIILYIPSHPTLKFHGATSVYDICHLESQTFWSAKHWIHYISGLNNNYQMVNSKTGINLYE